MTRAGTHRVRRAKSQIIARRTAFRPFLARYRLDADVAFAITASSSHNHATAFETSDDDGRAGVAFVLDGVTYYHRHYSLIPGTVALHVTDRDLTPLHEFQHALGSYTNGQVIDLYDPDDRGINKKQGRPIPAHFATYDGVDYASDPSRDGIGYGPNWRSYHCELHFPSAPAVMDNYYEAPASLGPLACENDKITRRFLLDRLRVKINRCFREGQSPESIVQSFPTLRLEQVYGAITYYLAHQSDIDAYLEQARQDYEAAREQERTADPAFYERLAEARQQRVTPE